MRWHRLFVAGSLLGWLMVATSALAQSAAFPPWPILYKGDVVVGEAPWMEPGWLTVRIGNWESEAVSVRGGTFECADPCLIAGPPDHSYIGEPVTFHLKLADDEEAVCSANIACLQSDYIFPFPRLDEPQSLTIRLKFPEPPETTLIEPDDRPKGDVDNDRVLPWPFFGGLFGGAALLAVLAVWWRLRRTYRVRIAKGP